MEKGKDKGKYAENTTWQASQTVDKMQTVDYAKLTPLLTKALQELEARIKVLEDA